MPLYDFICDNCSKVKEVIQYDLSKPECCGRPMRRIFGIDKQLIKIRYPGWVDRMEDIHKAQEQRGERLRIVHPSEVM